VVTDLRAHDYDVIATDVAVTRADREDGMLQADLTDYGQAVEELGQADAVVHLANIPAPGLSTPAVTFNNNITMNFNVFQAAADTVMNRPSAELLAEAFPGIPLTRDVGKFGTLLAIDRARQVLGFEPAHSWRDHVPA